jgi:hypothetical protein
MENWSSIFKIITARGVPLRAERMPFAGASIIAIRRRSRDDNASARISVRSKRTAASSGSASHSLGQILRCRKATPAWKYLGEEPESTI